ncbi:hypothetical protein DDV82_10305, partial [Campylobacter jejuni]
MALAKATLCACPPEISSIFLYLKSSISKVLSILGGSGSGKSTLLRIIAKLEQASSYDLFSCK